MGSLRRTGVCAANNVARACYIMMSFWHHNCLFTLLLILVNFKSLLWPQFLTNFNKQECILKLRISSLQPCIICEDPWWFTYESQKNNDQICDSGLFLQNALVEYTGVLQTPIRLYANSMRCMIVWYANGMRWCSTYPWDIKNSKNISYK